MICVQPDVLTDTVALRAGAWIEIQVASRDIRAQPSHSVRVRGLKCAECLPRTCALRVALRAGAWIEIKVIKQKSLDPCSRTPCGCVD